MMDGLRLDLDVKPSGAFTVNVSGFGKWLSGGEVQVNGLSTGDGTVSFGAAALRLILSIGIPTATPASIS